MPEPDTTVTAPTRRAVLDVPGTFNLRDVGGLTTARGPVRTGVLFRSDGLADLGERGRRAFTGLGLRTVVDLRQAIECEQRPSDLPVSGGPSRFHISIFGGEFDVHSTAFADIGDIYRLMLDRCAPALTAAVRQIAAPGALPGLVHCSAGKDRTGIVVALTLSLVGVPAEQVVDDYAYTAEVLNGAFRERLEQRAQESGMETQSMAVTLQAPASAMADTLDYLATTYGGAETYLRAHGLTDAERDRLRLALVD